MKKLFQAAFVVLFLSGAGLAAQAQTNANAGQPWAIGKVSVSAEIRKTPFFYDENEDQKVVKGKDSAMKRAKHWICIDIEIKTNDPKAARRWPKWLDDVEVTAYVLAPMLNNNGLLTWTILTGTQKLNPIQANNDTHTVRMFIPPYVIYRYFEFGKTKDGQIDVDKQYSRIEKDLKRWLKMPMFVQVQYGEKTVAGCQMCGSDVYSRLKETADAGDQVSRIIMNRLRGESGNPTRISTERMFRYLIDNKTNPSLQRLQYQDVLLPPDKTPFAWVMYDSMATPQIEKGK